MYQYYTVKYLYCKVSISLIDTCYIVEKVLWGRDMYSYTYVYICTYWSIR